MTDRCIDLESLIHKSWENAVKRGAASEDSSNKSLCQTHKDRAIAWIDCLGEGFQEYYSNKDQRVFWKNNEDNRSDFHLNELLFDVSVCQIGWVESIVRGRRLPYISNCLWQVESEFDNRDSREIMKDFSKLVMGRAESQMFVSTYQGVRQKQVMSMCSTIASCCNGNLYLCFVEHPEKWSNGPKRPSLFRWEDNDWRPF